MLEEDKNVCHPYHSHVTAFEEDVRTSVSLCGEGQNKAFMYDQFYTIMTL